MTQGEVTGWRPSVWTSLTQFWIISLALTIAGALLGFVAASAPSPKGTSTASIILTDPTSDSLFSGDVDTHNTTQVATIKLDSTVRAAATLLAKRLPSAHLDFEALRGELSVSGGTGSQLVEISVTDTRPLVAQAAATAVVDAYATIAQQALNQQRTNALDQNAAATADIEKSLATTGPLVAIQSAELNNLATLRAQIISDATAANGPIAVSSPATLPGVKRTIPPPVGLVAGGLVGLLAAIVLTRLLAQARQRFSGRFEPELIFATPLLADVPTFSAERLPSDLPSVDSATSSVSEAYRFATTAITSGAAKIVAVVSAASSEGKSSCAANLAVTAAYQGSRVLVIDADFEGKGVSFLLGQDFDRRPGLLDVLDGTVAIDDVVSRVEFAEDLTLLSGGQAAGYDWPDVLSTQRWPQLAQRLRERYDLVIIDLPPFLQIAYAVPIVRAVDGVVVVIPHKSSVSRGAELAERLRFVGVETLGYLYVKSPLRREIGLVSRLATDEERRPTQRGKRAIVAGDEHPPRGRIPVATIPLDPADPIEPVAPAEPVAPVAPAERAEPVASADSVVSAEPAGPVDGVASVEPEPAGDLAVPAEPEPEPESATAADDPSDPAPAAAVETPAIIPDVFLEGVQTPLVLPPEPSVIAVNADILPAPGAAQTDDSAEDAEDDGEPFVVPATVPRVSFLPAAETREPGVEDAAQPGDPGAGAVPPSGPAAVVRPAVAAFVTRETTPSAPSQASAVLTDDPHEVTDSGGADARSTPGRAGASVNRQAHSRNRKPRPRR